MDYSGRRLYRWYAEASGGCYRGSGIGWGIGISPVLSLQGGPQNYKVCICSAVSFIDIKQKCKFVFQILEYKINFIKITEKYAKTYSVKS